MRAAAKDESIGAPGAAEWAEASPVMAQWFAAKARAGDALVFFRMGDFYELFFDDAKAAAPAMGVALTQRGSHAGAPIPMAGVPVHAVDAYIAKLIAAGFRVAIVEQVETPARARGRGPKTPMKRELARIVTPGTLVDEALLPSRGANRLAAVHGRGDAWAVASLELSTGEMEVLRTAEADLAATLALLAPAELLIADRLVANVAAREALKACAAPVRPLAASLAEAPTAASRLRRLYDVATLDGFGAYDPIELGALGLIAAYLEATQSGRRPVLRPPRRAGETAWMIIDPATRASLEIDPPAMGGSGGLQAAIDRTVTAAGSRLLAARLARPLLDPAAIAERLDASGALLDQPALRRALRDLLARCGDMARSFGRLSLGRGGPRDLACLRDTLMAGTAILARLRADASPLAPAPTEITDIAARLDIDPAGLSPLAAALGALVPDRLPAQARDGGFVAAGARGDLDEARALRDGSRRILGDIEQRAAAEAGVALRLRYNAVLGYFLEASSRAAEPLLRPPLSTRFIHRQTLANQARFTTPELADVARRVADAGERALAIELEVFEALRDLAIGHAEPVQAAADALARLDVAASDAEWASETGGVRPAVDHSRLFLARGARHPVVEAAVKAAGEPYMANDCVLDGTGETGPRLAIVTGPNMAGKSTFLRQNAILAVMAQAGLHVPAKALRLGVVDRLFSRVGSGDDLARGRSTFMTEMIETAAILIGATDRSLVILDEIGRGTATWDGLAIAWASAEALHEGNRCRALFATHYHELAELETRLGHVANLSLKVKEWNGALVFLHEAGPGPADRSYGVQVARLAGVPPPVLTRAQEILTRLEGRALAADPLAGLPLFQVREPSAPPPTPCPGEMALAALDIDSLSPREALDRLYDLKGLVR